MHSEFHFQIRPRDDAERHPVPPAVVAVDEHVVVLDAAKPALEKRLTVHCLAHHHLGPPAREAPIVVGAPQRPIEPGRRHFEGVRRRHHVFDVETALRSRLTRAQSSTLTLSSAVAAGPGRSIWIRRTIPLASRRNCTSKISRP